MEIRFQKMEFFIFCFISKNAEREHFLDARVVTVLIGNFI